MDTCKARRKTGLLKRPGGRFYITRSAVQLPMPPASRQPVSQWPGRAPQVPPIANGQWQGSAPVRRRRRYRAYRALCMAPSRNCGWSFFSGEPFIAGADAVDVLFGYHSTPYIGQTHRACRYLRGNEH
jgi:hypothetical protein